MKRVHAIHSRLTPSSGAARAVTLSNKLEFFVVYLEVKYPPFYWLPKRKFKFADLHKFSKLI